MNGVGDKFHQLEWSLGLHCFLLGHELNERVHIEYLKRLALIEIITDLGYAKNGRLIPTFRKLVVHIFLVELFEYLF